MKYTWLLFALLTVSMWGVYGIFLHKGQIGMADQTSGRYKAFLFVGIAYFLVAIVAPLAVLIAQKPDWNMPMAGIKWSLLAGTVGSFGAFGVLLALGSKGGTPAAVMSIIFAGAPIVNAVIAVSLHPPDGGWGAIRWPFWVGILLAALGGCLVTLFKPAPAAKKMANKPVVSKSVNSKQ